MAQCVARAEFSVGGGVEDAKVVGEQFGGIRLSGVVDVEPKVEIGQRLGDGVSAKKGPDDG